MGASLDGNVQDCTWRRMQLSTRASFSVVPAIEALDETVSARLAEGDTVLADGTFFRHDDLVVSPPQGRFGTPAFKNTSSIAFAWKNSRGRRNWRG